VIINCAASVFKKEELDLTTRVNVGGPLQLLSLANDCPNLEAFVQVSTCFVNNDKSGLVDEKIYEDSKINWQ